MAASASGLSTGCVTYARWLTTPAAGKVILLLPKPPTNVISSDVPDICVVSCSAEQVETYRVGFTSMGFRYVQVVGYPGVPTAVSTYHNLLQRYPS